MGLARSLAVENGERNHYVFGQGQTQRHPEELKKSLRKRALKYHPKIPNAEKFKQISHAV